MILPDTNLLIYAYDSNGSFHERAKTWWEFTLNEQDNVALCWPVIWGYLRILTHPRILENPMPVDGALERIKSWITLPNVSIIQPGNRHFDIVGNLLRDAGIGGNLTTDAQIAAIAIEHQCELHSNDNDFARFSGLQWINPLT